MVCGGISGKFEFMLLGMERVRLIVVASLLGILMASCQSVPIDVEAFVIQSMEEKDFPLKLRAEIVLPFGNSDRTILMEKDGEFVALEDGKAVVKTSSEVFGRVFRESKLRGEVENPHVTIRIKSDSSVNRLWGSFEAEAAVDLHFGNGDPIRSYKGRGKVHSGLVSDQVALENAYKEAFFDVVAQMVRDEKVIQALSNKANISRMRLTDAPHLPKASIYNDFLRTVVTVNVGEVENSARFARPVGNKLSHGSGFFVNDQGLILTNFHVVKDSVSIEVVAGGKNYWAELVGYDEWVDMALLKIDAVDTPCLKIEPEQNMAGVGDEVLAIGSPLRGDLEYSVSKGIVSSYRMIGGYPLVQTDAAINHGSSGGPLVHLKSGSVIGIITMRYFGQGIGFAITGDAIVHFLKESGAKNGRIRNGKTPNKGEASSE